jgi:hypothetical protein
MENYKRELIFGILTFLIVGGLDYVYKLMLNKNNLLLLNYETSFGISFVLFVILVLNIIILKKKQINIQK